MVRVLIIGGYGNFGGFITQRLAVEPNLQLIVAGRSLAAAEKFITTIESKNAIKASQLDICSENLKQHVESLAVDIVIHTSGPFQKQNYAVAQMCIELRIDYIDLADSREFVAGIHVLHQQACQAGVTVISGASSVPCFSSAIIEHYAEAFETIESIDYGISTAQKSRPGLSTTQAILSYVGKPFKTIMQGKKTSVYGWQGLKSHSFKHIGRRLLCYCDIPDLTLFPDKYTTLTTLRFYAGLESKFSHTMLWLISYLVRWGMIKNLQNRAQILQKISAYFDRFGTDSSGFFMHICGLDQQNKKKETLFELTALDGDGPMIPCIPAIVLTQRLASKRLNKKGAMACVGLLSLEDYLEGLTGLNIIVEER